MVLRERPDQRDDRDHQESVDHLENVDQTAATETQVQQE